MSKTFSFKVSDDSVNEYGGRVMTKGIDISGYMKNPVVLWMHKRDYEWDDQNDKPLPIGKCVKVWKENDALYADIVFDDKDAFAASIAQKVEDGFLSAVSGWFRPTSRSEDAKDMLPGQTLATITSCRLLEISVVDIPANPNAVKLAAASPDNLLFSLSAPFAQVTTNHKNSFPKMKELICSKFGIDPALTDEQVVDAVADKLNAVKKEAAEQKATALVDGAVDSGKIAPADRDTYLNLAKSNYDSTASLISKLSVSMPGVKDKLTIGKKNSDAGKDTPEFDKLSKDDPKELQRIKAEEPERFAAILEEKKAFVNRKLN